MIISHKHKFLFVEIPHTASHSIAEQLISHYGGEAIIRKHANVTQFLAQASADEKSYYKFATVRNPLDTATTDYAKLQGNHKGQFTNPAMLIENGGHVTADHLREFRFVQESTGEFPAFFRRFRCKLYNNWFLIGRQHFDYVIRFENLQDGFSKVLRQLGIKQVEKIPHVNRTQEKKKSFDQFYTKDLYPLAARYYGPFMRRWHYDFPVDWGTLRIPLTTRLSFAAVDRCANLAANFLLIDPDRPAVHKAKKALDFITHRR